MSSISITPYFSFCRVHIYDQLVTEGKSVIYVRPDKRFKPACYVCKNKCDTIHKWVKRSIRDLDFGPIHVSIECIYRQIFCMTCGSILDMTVVLDYLTGRVVWMGEGRRADTLMKFFDGMTEEQIQKLEAIAMYMWDPFIKAVDTKAPHVKIVFDLFHMVKEFNKVIDRVRIDESTKRPSLTRR